MELVGNLQTYEFGLTRIGKGSKNKSMALKAKSNETFDDEDFDVHEIYTIKYSHIYIFSLIFMLFCV